MGCLMVLFTLVTPRFIMFLLWVFTDYLSHAFGSYFWPLLGFFFLPTTTMAYAVAENEFHGIKGMGARRVDPGRDGRLRSPGRQWPRGRTTPQR